MSIFFCYTCLPHFMTQSKTNKSSPGWFLLKLVLAVLAFRFVLLKMNGHGMEYLNQFKGTFRSPSLRWQMAGVIVLMLLNWFLEALKWRQMIRKIEYISIIRAMEAVFSGVSISIFTPNRVGEFAGRIFHLGRADKLQATLVTIIENFSQLLVTLIFGSVAIVIYFSKYTEMTAPFVFLIAAVLFVCCLIATLAFFNIRILEGWFSKSKFSLRWKEFSHVLTQYTKTELASVIFKAILRYLIFSIQLLWLIRIFGGVLPAKSAMLMTMCTFFVMTVVPTFTLTELGIRGAIASHFFSYLTPDLLPVLIAVFSLWIINLALPALIGSVCILNFRLSGRKAE